MSCKLSGFIFLAASLPGFCLHAQAADPETAFYCRVTLPVPAGVRLEVSGLAQMDDGRLGVATRNGEVWLVSNPSSESLTNISYKLFASGLHEPLGLAWRDGAFYTAQRSEITRLRDSNGDSVADEYDAAAKGWGVSGNYHEYVYGPVFDLTGKMWITLNSTLGKGLVPRREWRGWAVAFGSDGKLQPMSAGLRSPSGIGLSADGAVFTTDQQGNWVPTCSLLHLQPGVFFGHADSLSPDVAVEPPLRAKDVPNEVTLAEARQRMPQFRLPAAWFPYRKMGQSTTDVVSDNTGGKFGPFAGQLFVGEFVQSCIFRVFLEKVRGEYQGACFPFRKGFHSAVVRLAFAKDGSLFVGESNRGWNSIGDRSFGLERLVWSGEVPFEVQEMRALRDGFELVFTQPIDPVSARAVDALKLSSYTYLYHETYGSEEIETRQLPVRVANISADARHLRLRVDGLRDTFVHELHLPGIRSQSGEPLLHSAAYYTLNRIPE
jgi:glucose/arabinose dehydrogenase